MSAAPHCTFAELPAKLRTSVSGYAVIAFDVFDTLLLRHVAADDVKELCAREFASALARPGDARAFYERRRGLERELCEESLRRGGDYEFRHADLLRRWVAEFAPADAAEQIRDALAAFELDREVALTLPSPTARDALEVVAEQGRRAIWVSDMYLPTRAIDALLAAHGLRDLLRAGYASSTDRHTKRSGRLYVDVLTSERIRAGDLMVVGDDRHADVDAPRTLGIPALWLHDPAARARRRGLDRAHARWRRVAATSGARVAMTADCTLGPRPTTPNSAHAELGELLGATFTAFALEVHEQARARGLRHLYFLSREGATFLRLYRSLARALEAPAPTATYLCASRRATFLPSLPALDQPTLAERLWQRYPQQSLGQLLADLSLDDRELAGVAAEHGLTDPEAQIDMPASDARLAGFLADARTQATFARAKADARAGLVAYARACGLVGNAGPIGLVDVGWKGSIQSQLLAALAATSPAAVVGFYLALAGGDDDGPHSTKCAYVYDHRRDPARDAVLLENSQAFEMFASARHGAVVGYGLRHGHAGPVLAPEPSVTADAAAAVRRALFAAAARWIAAIARLRPSAADLRPYLLERLHRYVRYPTRAQAEAFLGYAHAESFGTSAVADYAFAGSWRRIVLGGAPWNLPARARAAFAKQEWPAAALRRSRLPGANWLYDRYRSR